jgi:hypothetical protein
MDGTPPVDKLVDVYIKIRDAKDLAKKAYEEKNAELTEQLNVIESEILEICKATGAESIKTQYGLAMRSIKTRYWTNDWEKFYKFITEHNSPELLERRIHQTNIKQFLIDNPDVLPQGLNVDNAYSITVRRSK